jgi:hypothetical protein
MVNRRLLMSEPNWIDAMSVDELPRNDVTSVSIADVYLIPQLDSARRFNVDTTRWARLTEIYAACMALPAFQKAAPGMQPDAC